MSESLILLESPPRVLKLAAASRTAKDFIGCCHAHSKFQTAKPFNDQSFTSIISENTKYNEIPLLRWGRGGFTSTILEIQQPKKRRN